MALNCPECGSPLEEIGDYDPKVYKCTNWRCAIELDADELEARSE